MRGETGRWSSLLLSAAAMCEETDCEDMREEEQ